MMISHALQLMTGISQFAVMDGNERQPHSYARRQALIQD
jgi:hypothetical protein